MSEIQLLRKVLVLADKLLLELDTNRFPFTARKKLREAITAAQQSVQPTPESGGELPAVESNRKGSAPASSG